MGDMARAPDVDDATRGRARNSDGQNSRQPPPVGVVKPIGVCLHVTVAEPRTGPCDVVTSTPRTRVMEGAPWALRCGDVQPTSVTDRPNADTRGRATHKSAASKTSSRLRRHAAPRRALTTTLTCAATSHALRETTRPRSGSTPTLPA